MIPASVDLHPDNEGKCVLIGYMFLSFRPTVVEEIRDVKTELSNVITDSAEPSDNYRLKLQLRDRKSVV